MVSHYEQHDDLARTLVALAQQDVAPHEVLVTDDGSRRPPEVPDGVVLLTQADDGFRVARARNRAAAAATGDVLVFLDADTVPEPAFVRRVTALPRAEPDVLVVGRRRHTRFGALDPAAPLAGAEEAELEEPGWLTDGWAASDDLRHADDGSFRHVIAATMACSAGWFARVGGFAESFVDYGGEDWDLAHRWWTAGGRLRHEPGAVAWHHGDHAGAGERQRADSSERRTAETVAVARHVNAWPASFRGLRAAPARLVVTHDEGLADRELLVAVDGLLAAEPLAEVVSDRAVWREIGDARVRATPSTPAAAALGLHLHRGVRADRDGWSEVAASDLGDATHLRLTIRGAPVVTLTRLRVLRRAHLGLEPVTTRATPVPDALRLVGGTDLDAWLGRWSDDRA